MKLGHLKQPYFIQSFLLCLLFTLVGCEASYQDAQQVGKDTGKAAISTQKQALEKAKAVDNIQQQQFEQQKKSIEQN